MGVKCWSHARRRFDEAVKALPKAKQKNSQAYLALNMIQAIYREENRKRIKDEREYAVCFCRYSLIFL